MVPRNESTVFTVSLSIPCPENIRYVIFYNMKKPEPHIFALQYPESPTSSHIYNCP